MVSIHEHRATKRILVVDDERIVREALRQMLALDNHVITVAENGVEALKVFQVGEFDLIVTDYQMPEMMGDEMTRRIRELSPTMPIIMITAHPEQLEEKRYLFNLIICKPFRIDELRQAVARL